MLVLMNGLNLRSGLIPKRSVTFTSKVGGRVWKTSTFKGWARGCSPKIGDVNSRGVLPYMGYVGMCGPKEWSLSAVLVT